MSSRINAGGWLQGKTVKKSAAGTSVHTRSSTPQQVQSTSTTIFGGGVKDPSGRVSEYFVRFSILRPIYTTSSSLASQWKTNVPFVRVTDT